CTARSTRPLASASNAPQDTHRCAASSRSSPRTVTARPGGAWPTTIRSGSSTSDLAGVTSIRIAGSSSYFDRLCHGSRPEGPQAPCYRDPMSGEGADVGQAAIQQLRYELYCLARHFIDPRRCLANREIDE